MSRDVPLCVDLDGTLAKTDLFLESAITAVKRNWTHIFQLPAWLVRGRASAKSRLAKIDTVDPATIPYNDKLIKYLKAERENGRKIILATASDRRIAEKIARHLGIFDGIIASDGTTNLKGEAKASALVELYGERGYAYAGNSRSDLPVWRRAKAALLVNTSRSVSEDAAALAAIEQEFHDRKPVLQELVREARPHQWLKNLLVFIPPMAGHMLFQPTALSRTILTFAALCAAASGIYIINDLFDLEADRKHPRKRRRPFASGDLPLQYGLAGPILILLGLEIGLAVSPEIMLVLYLYATISLTYSQYLKTKPLVDVFCLAGLYTIRVVAGGIASNSGVSIWLLNFSGFLFLSLGFLKRYAEYPLGSNTHREHNLKHSRRGYKEPDSLLLIIMGVGSSFISTLVLGLYVNTTQSQLAYKTPFLLWGIVPLALFWQCRMWLSTVRGDMHEDPVVYAAKDRISYLVVAVAILIYVLASVELPSHTLRMPLDSLTGFFKITG